MARTLQEVELEEMIQRAIKSIGNFLRVEMAILFGSYAQGKADEWSDIDLAIVSPDFEKMSLEERIEMFSKISYVNGAWIQFHAFTPNDLIEARPTNFLGHILKTGKIVYKDGRFL